MMQENEGAPQCLRPMPRQLEVLDLIAVMPRSCTPIFDDVSAHVLMYMESPLWRILRCGGVIGRYHEGLEALQDEDPIDKEEFENGEPILIWPSCGHFCRLEHVGGAFDPRFIRTCQCCGRQTHLRRGTVARLDRRRNIWTMIGGELE